MIASVICLRQQRLADCVSACMRRNPDIRVVEQTDKANVAIQAIMGVLPELVICEDTDQGSALDILKASARFSPATYFLVCNTTPDTGEFLELLRAGMNDLLTREWTEDEVERALERFRSRRRDAEKAGRVEPAKSLRRVLDKQFFEDTIVTDAGATVLEDLPMLEEEYQISFAEGLCQALFFVIDPRPREDLLAEAFLPMLELERAARTFFGQQFETVVCYLKEDSLSVILNTAGTAPDMRQLCRRFLSECSRTLSWLSGQNTLSVGVGPGTRDFRMLPLEIQAAKFAAWMRLSEGKGRVLEYGSYLSRHMTKEAFLDADAKDALTAAVRARDCDGCVKLVSELLRSAENAGACISRALCINDQLSWAFNRYGRTELVESGKYLKHARNMPPTVEGVASLELLIPMMTDWIRQCFAMLEDQSRDGGERDMRRAKAYIQTHFAEPLRLEEVAAYVNLSPTYFCAKFKKETNQTFVGYLTAIRLEESKALLTGTGLKIGQIAERVGFQDARHFSRVFQKQNGVLPSEYRRIAEESGSPTDK